MRLSNGFTLIELLIVIAILGILATIVVVAINPSQRIYEAQDKGHEATLHQIASALEVYAASHDGHYPIATNFTSISGPWSCGNCTDLSYNTGTDWIPELVSGGYIKSLPLDPKAGQEPLCSSWPAASRARTGYLYKSDGADYKLIGLCVARATFDHATHAGSYCTGYGGTLIDPNDIPPPPIDPIFYTNSYSYYTAGAVCW